MTQNLQWGNGFWISRHSVSCAVCYMKATVEIFVKIDCSPTWVSSIPIVGDGFSLKRWGHSCTNHSRKGVYLQVESTSKREISQEGDMIGSFLGRSFCLGGCFSGVRSEWLLLCGDWLGAEKWRLRSFHVMMTMMVMMITANTYWEVCLLCSRYSKLLRYILTHLIFTTTPPAFSPFNMWGNRSPELLSDLPKTNSS